MPDRGVPETYAGPALRLGLFYADHPTCDRPRFRTCRFGDIDPEGQHGADLADVTVVVCTLTWTTPDGTVHDSNGWVPVPFYEERRGGAKVWLRHHPGDSCQQKGQAHQELVGQWIDRLEGVDMVDELQTKAQGRALKRAGYAADTKDLQAVIAWRHRVAEVEATRDGKAPGPRSQRETERALAAAGQSGDIPDRPEAGDREQAPDAAQQRVEQRQEGEHPAPGADAQRGVLLERARAVGAGDKMLAFVADRFGAHTTLTPGQLKVVTAWVESAEKQAGVSPARSQGAASAPQAPATADKGAGGTEDTQGGPSGPQGALGGLLAIAMAELDEVSKAPDGEEVMAAIAKDLRDRGWSDAVQRLDEDQLGTLLSDIIPAHSPA